jgi:hypothetical protein
MILRRRKSALLRESGKSLEVQEAAAAGNAALRYCTAQTASRLAVLAEN